MDSRHLLPRKPSFYLDCEAGVEERERCERLMAEVLKATAELMAAREATARIAGELAAYQARPWWRRLAG
jgi:hypothetical protein